MLKNFEEQFIHYCKSVNFEINQNQIEVIKKLQNYFEKNFKSSFLKFFSFILFFWFLFLSMKLFF
mgnify:CR=1 FL=1